MRRVSVLVGLLVASTALGPWFGAVAQQPAATPGPAASPEVTRLLAEFVAEITLGTDLSSAAAGMAVADDGAVYVIDSLNDLIQVFGRGGLTSTGPRGASVATWGESGDAPGQFRFSMGHPYWGDLAFGPDGNLYVLDPFNSRIQVFGSDGTYPREWGEPGSGEGQFDEPSGIGIDDAGRVYVAETGNRRLQIFGSDGQFIAVWEPSEAEGGPFLDPADVAVDAAGIVSVTDFDKNRIFRFDAQGTVIDIFGELGWRPGQLFQPWGAAVDAQGNLYVAEYGNSRVQGFAPDRTSLGTVGSFGDQPGEFNGANFLTIGPDGLLYVADEANRRVQVFRLLPPLSTAQGTPVAA